MRELAYVVGVLAATQLAVYQHLYIIEHYRPRKTKVFSTPLSYESTVTLDAHSKANLQWWIKSLCSVNGRPFQEPPPTMIIESDASNTGWGAHCGMLKTRGQWSSEESTLHINCKEMLAAFLALQTFAKGNKKIHVQLKVENTTTMYHINRMGGTHSQRMTKLTHILWYWSLGRMILLSAEHLPGKLNQVADLESRRQGDSSEWKLKPGVFRQLMEQMGPCQMNLFASCLTAQLEIYVSWRPDPGAVTTDALSQSWSNQRLCLPTFLLNREMPEQSTSGTGARASADRTSVADPVSMSIRVPIQIPAAMNLLTNHRGEQHPLIRQGSLNLATWLVSGDPSRQQELQKQSCILEK